MCIKYFRKETEDAAVKERTQTQKEKEQRTDEERDLLRFKFKLQNKADTKRKECGKQTESGSHQRSRR